MMDLTQKQWVKHSVFHPFEGFEDLRWKKGGSVLYATIVVLLWFVAQIIHDNLVGYQFAVTNTKMFSIVPYIVQTIAVFLVFVIGNWSICTLLDGEGTIKKIYLQCLFADTLRCRTVYPDDLVPCTDSGRGDLHHLRHGNQYGMVCAPDVQCH